MYMTSIRCVIIDDEPFAVELLRGYLLATNGVTLQAAFTDAVAAIEFLKRETTDLLFVDIHMPDVNGLELVRSLREPPLVIFTTAHREFGFEGFELDAVDYLLKPISLERFSRAVEKVKESFSNRKGTPGEHLVVYSEYRMVRVNLADIEYIESLEDYIRIHLVSGKSIMTLMTLKGVLEKLPGRQFQRIHRSYIIRTACVQSILNRKITLQSGVQLPVSDSYAGFIREWKK